MSPLSMANVGWGQYAKGAPAPPEEELPLAPPEEDEPLSAVPPDELALLDSVGEVLVPEEPVLALTPVLPVAVLAAPGAPVDPVAEALEALELSVTVPNPGAVEAPELPTAPATLLVEACVDELVVPAVTEAEPPAGWLEVAVVPELLPEGDDEHPPPTTRIAARAARAKVM